MRCDLIDSAVAGFPVMHHSDWWNAFQSRKSLQRPLGTALPLNNWICCCLCCRHPRGPDGNLWTAALWVAWTCSKRINQQDRDYDDRHHLLTSQLLDVSASVSPLFPLDHFCLKCVLSSWMSVPLSACTANRSKRTKSQCADRSGSECVSVGICISGAWLTCKSCVCVLYCCMTTVLCNVTDLIKQSNVCVLRQTVERQMVILEIITYIPPTTGHIYNYTRKQWIRKLIINSSVNPFQNTNTVFYSGQILEDDFF